jgi:hypothetical protein
MANVHICDEYVQENIQKQYNLDLLTFLSSLWILFTGSVSQLV